MRSIQRALGALGLLLSGLLLAGVATAADRPYTEGAVMNVTSVRTEPGRFEEYMKYLAGPYKQVMEEQKKAGVILDYMVYRTMPRGPGDPDLYLIVVYKDMAALDGLNARTDPISEKLFGGMDQQSAAMIERGKMRTLIGVEQIRKLDLK